MRMNEKIIPNKILSQNEIGRASKNIFSELGGKLLRI